MDAPHLPEILATRLRAGEGGRGAEVLLVERHDLPLVRVQVSFDVAGLVQAGRIRRGALDALGVAWREGTRALGPAWARELETLGGVAGTGCDPRVCSVSVWGPREEMEPLVARLAELVRDPAIPASAVERWRREAREEWRSDWRSDGIVHQRAFQRLLYPDGDPRRADRARVDFAGGVGAVRAAWRTVVEDAAACVTVIGDTTMAEVLPALEAGFGWLDGETRGVARGAAMPADARAVLVQGWSSTPRVSLVWPSPGATHADQPAWQLVANALVGSFASRVNLRLREEAGLTYLVEGAYLEEAGSGYTYVAFDVDEERLGEALRLVDAELERARVEGLDEATLIASRNLAWTTGDADVGPAWRLANQLTAAWSANLPTGHFLMRLPAYAGVGLEEARAAAARWLAMPRTLLVTGDPDVTEPIVRATGWTAIERWSRCEAVYGGACP